MKGYIVVVKGHDKTEYHVKFIGKEIIEIIHYQVNINDNLLIADLEIRFN